MARTHTWTCNTGDLLTCRGGNGEGPRRQQESEERVVPLKPGNAGGGKALWFEVRLDEERAGGLA